MVDKEIKVTVVVGSLVELKETGDQNERVIIVAKDSAYAVLSPNKFEEARIVINESPIAKAIMGQEVGFEASFKIPEGQVRRLKIQSIGLFDLSKLDPLLKKSKA